MAKLPLLKVQFLGTLSGLLDSHFLVTEFQRISCVDDAALLAWLSISRVWKNTPFIGVIAMQTKSI
ncbi:MAG: hypothetical protein ACJA08_002433 [Cyclobacteriaceae bacterium]|jgi:hypothetical protein